MLKKTTFVCAAAFALAFFSWAQNPTEYKVPSEDSSKPNPVKPTPESLAKAKKLYAMDCAMCHGAKGDGKGDVGAEMKNIPDFTDSSAMKNVTDGDLFYVIKSGKADMPPEGPRAKADEIWNLVNYIRAFGKK